MFQYTSRHRHALFSNKKRTNAQIGKGFMLYVPIGICIYNTYLLPIISYMIIKRFYWQVMQIALGMYTHFA